MAARGPRGWVLALLVAQVSGEFGVVRVFPEKGGGGGGGGGKDYCILFNSQWAHLPHDLGKAVPPAGNQSQYEEIDIPVALLSYEDMLDIGQSFGHSAKVALYAPGEPVLDYNMVIIFVMAVGTVAIGGYWAGSRDVKKRYVKHKRDDGAEKHEDETVDVTPVMIGVFVVMCCSMLVLLYYFYDQLVYAIIGIFCLAASIGLYSCLSPFVRRFPLGKCRIPSNNWPYFHKRPQVRMLLLATFCVAVSLFWGLFRNEDQWAWILQDTLGIAFCLYMLKTIRLPTFKGCTLLLLVLFVYDVFFVFITPYLTKTGESIMVEVAAGPTDSSTREKLPMVLKVPRLNFSPLALCDRPFSLLGFGDILVPGLLVAYCHRFDIQVQSSRVYFVACTIGYGIGLLVTFAALAWMQKGQPALLYLVPCTLLTSLLVALWRRELAMFWTGSGFAKDLPHPPLVISPVSCPAPPEGESSPASHPEADGEAAASAAPPREPASTPLGGGKPPAPFLAMEEEEEEKQTDASEPCPNQPPAKQPDSPKDDDDNVPGRKSPSAKHSQSG
ncbi:signal peptide peptidase-like 2B isoform X3 [Candoia aspera]|uniref:signal peptide peptidase-like 2B isoform X3 n=1 Tax=Candoia aspera TaxID=51853 RepID=UPI002FD7CEF3